MPSRAPMVDGLAEPHQCKRVNPLKTAAATGRHDDRFDRRTLLTGVTLLCAGLRTYPMATPAQAADAPPEILAFGDSISAGLGLPTDQAFPTRLGAKLRAQGLTVRVINAG